jgi:AraC family transcriptional activator of pobA
MDQEALIPIYTVHDVEFDLGKVEFAIGRIEALSAPVLRNALVAHRCDFYQILWITQGEGKIWLDLDLFPVEPGTMCFASPGQIRAYEPQGPVAGYVIGFTQGFFSDSPDDANVLIQLPYFHGVGAAPVLYANEEQARLFTEVCSRLERETQLALDGQATLLHSYMRILLIEARRIHQAQPGAIHTGETAFLLTKQFVLLVEAHYLTTSSVADYATMLHVTTNHLIETVKGTLGQPAGKIIHERLMLEAKRLLRYSDSPVAEIATHLNFEDPSYFSRFFKKHTDFSPSEFRAQP